MDSLSQLTLGAAVGIAVMGRRTAVWKAAAWGALAGTLPDLDAFIDHGDAVSNMTMHRAHSHGLFWLTLLAPILGWLAARVHAEQQHWRRWAWAMWLVLVTHPLLDTMTVYGTQLLQPFSDHPFAVGSIFIIDPLYTLPLLVGVAVALSRQAHRGLRANAMGLALSTAYLAWSAAAQAHVQGVVEHQRAAQGAPAGQVLVTPAPLNTLLWRVLVMHEDAYEEGFYALADRGRPIRFDRFARDPALRSQLDDVWAVQRMAWFSRGFFRLRDEAGTAVLTDLRMGQEPGYVFSFRVARRQDDRWLPVQPGNLGWRADAMQLLSWLGPRMLGRDLPPPR
jgi:inner membrane protein